VTTTQPETANPPLPADPIGPGEVAAILSLSVAQVRRMDRELRPHFTPLWRRRIYSRAVAEETAGRRLVEHLERLRAQGSRRRRRRTRSTAQ